MTAVDSMAGKKLKAKSGWNDYNGASGNGTAEYGFSALPGGYRRSDGNFYDVGCYAYWWTATEYNADYAYFRLMDYINDFVYSDINSKSYGWSVRCVGY